MSSGEETPAHSSPQVRGDKRPDARAIVASAMARETPGIAPYVERILRGHEGAIRSIVFYGSLLSEATRRPTSFHDFYVIIDSLSGYHTRLRDRAVGALLPPSVYYIDTKLPGGERLRCKICVLTQEQLEAETSRRAKDIHNLGRFSKRMAVVYARDTAAMDQLVDACLSAARTLVPSALALLGTRFSLEDFLVKLLSLSYLGEQRVAEDSKILALLEAERSYYESLYRALLAEHGLVGTKTGEGASRELFEQPPPSQKENQRALSFLEQSRRRGKMRWPKYIFTVDNWLDIIVSKIERHHGIEVHLTERQRKHPLIFGWSTYFALRKRGIVK